MTMVYVKHGVVKNTVVKGIIKLGVKMAEVTRKITINYTTSKLSRKINKNRFLTYRHQNSNFRKIYKKIESIWQKLRSPILRSWR
jgi:hypothetical protein